MAFQRYDDSPSLMKPGVYQSGNVTEDQLGLNTIDLEKYSLGNWNSIVRNNRKFWSPLSDPTVSSLMGKGRPVQLEFAPSTLIKSNNYYDDNGLPTDVSVEKETFTQLRDNYQEDSPITPIGTGYPGLRAQFLKRDDQTNALTTFLKDDLKMQYGDGYGHIAERTASDIANNRLIIKLDSNLRTKRSRIVGGAWSTWWGYDPASYYDDGDNYDVQFQLHFEPEVMIHGQTPAEWGDTGFTSTVDSVISIRNPSNPNHVITAPILSYADGNVVIEVDDAVWSNSFDTENPPNNIGASLGYPNFTPSNPATDETIVPVDFEVSCFAKPDDWIEDPEGNDTISAGKVIPGIIGSPTTEYGVIEALDEKSLLYYDIDNPKFMGTSYPVKVYLGINLHGAFPRFFNEPQTPNYDENDLLGLFYGTGTVSTFQNILFEDSVNPGQGIYYYNVIQWGDEDVLLSDDEILNTEYFALYEREEYPEEDDFLFKRARHSQLIDSKKIIEGLPQRLNLSNHVYNTPGIKTIKIIVYRYTRDLNLLNETILVTKNIVINDGTALAQDFEIFGGTDFNFLPLSEKEAMIGGLDPESQYVVSTNKLKRTDLYEKDDFLDKKSSEEFIENFNDEQYGESLAEKLDLSQVRYFKSVSQNGIYHFINANIDSVVENNFPSFQDNFYNDSVVQDNSIATDIFINKSNSYLKEDCLVEINPEKTEFLSIDNTVGNSTKGILIGDYKLEKVENQKLRKLGIMETPNLEDNIEEQAF